MKQFNLILIFAIILFIQPEISIGQSGRSLTDPEIASVAVVANQIDIDYANIAMQRSKDPEILKFAQTMKDDHAAVIEQAVTLVTRLGVTPKTNGVSKKLISDAAVIKKRLREKSGKSFDREYIKNEVSYHKAVINAMQTTLIPGSKNADLKKLLQDVLPALQAHLAHAEMVQKMLFK